MTIVRLLYYPEFLIMTFQRLYTEKNCVTFLPNLLNSSLDRSLLCGDSSLNISQNYNTFEE